MRIRRAGEADCRAVSALSSRIFPGDQTDFSAEVSRISTRLWLAEEPAQSTPSSDANAATSVHYAGVVGFLLAWVVVDEIHLHLLGTAPEARGRGVARALLTPFLDPFLGDGELSCARLEVRRDNEGALALYRNAGFRIVNTRRRYYADGCDAFEMALPFQDGAPAPLAADDP